MKRAILFVLMALCTTAMFAQTITVKGTVIGAEDSQPVIGAYVLQEGTNNGTSTDLDGNYVLSVPKDANLVFSSVGFTTQVIPVNGRAVINVTLQTDAMALDETVVVAYGTAKKESITGAITSVNSKALEKRPVSNAVAGLEGMTSGVQINNSYGEPGATPTIRIRGFSTINGDNSPLYVVDGVPMSGSSNDINPNDIESISILKDAASAAMYGNRASNGVVLITTKKGKSDRFTVTATTNQGFYTRGTPEYDRMNADQFMEIYWRHLYNGLASQPSNAGKYTHEELAALTTDTFWGNVVYNVYNKPNDQVFDGNGKLTPGTAMKPLIAEDLDWYSPVERIGHRQEYNVSGNGATEKANFYFSTNYLDEKGYTKQSQLKRFSGRLNASIQPKKWIKIGTMISANHRVTDYTSQSLSTGYANPVYFARHMAPIYPVHVHDLTSANGDYALDANGNRQYDYGQLDSRPQNNGRHAIYEGELDLDQTWRNTMEGTVYADINFLKDFKFTIKGNLNTINTESRSYNNAIVGDGKGSGGRASRTIYRYRNYTFQQQLTWNRTFNDVHDAEVFLGHENYEYRYNYLYAYKTGETFANKYSLNNFANMTSLTDYSSGFKTEGYIARAKYGYDNKIFAEASFRRDGSSRFHPDNRWGNFWSLGGSWMISRENWMKDVNWVDNLKLRASYGEVGNDGSVDYYGYMALYTLTFNGEKPAAYKVQNEASDIVWESSNSFGVAVEGRFFNRFNLSLEYYDKRSHDLLFNVFLPVSAGGESTESTSATVTQNLGDISNRGIEVNFDIDLMKKKDFQWTFGFNASTLKNKILTLPEQNREAGIINGTKKYVEGGGIYDFWMYQTAGVDMMTGDVMYILDEELYCVGQEVEGKTLVADEYIRTINGKHYTTTTSYGKKDWEGSAIPDLFGSFNTAINYKNFSFSALFTYSIGGKMYDSVYYSLMTPGLGAMHVDLLNAWNGVPAGMTETSPNRLQQGVVPVIDSYKSTYNNSTADRMLCDASYLTIKNINASYSFPSKVCQKLDLTNINLSLSVENIYQFNARKGMNNQYSFNGTQANYLGAARTVSLGLNITL